MSQTGREGEREIERNRQTDRQTHRHTARHTNTTDRQIVYCSRDKPESAVYRIHCWELH